MSMQLKSTAFQDGQAIPRQYTADGENRSPPLEWTAPPTGTQSLALICEDPDAPRGIWVHWVLFNLPQNARKLDEGMASDGKLPPGAVQGTNDFRKIGYGGPAPPPGKPHRYFFKLYALDARLNLPTGTNRSQLLDAMRGHILAETQLMGKYGR